MKKPEHRRPRRKPAPARSSADRRGNARVPLHVPAALPPAGPTRVGASRVRTLPLAPTYEEWVRVARPGGARVKPRPTRPDRPKRTEEPGLERPFLVRGPAR